MARSPIIDKNNSSNVGTVMKTIITNIENTLKIPHLKIAHQGGNLEVGNLDIQGYQDCPPQLFVVFFVLIIDLGSVLRSQDLFSRALVSYNAHLRFKKDIYRPDF